MFKLIVKYTFIVFVCLFIFNILTGGQFWRGISSSISQKNSTYTTYQQLQQPKVINIDSTYKKVAIILCLIGIFLCFIATVVTIYYAFFDSVGWAVLCFLFGPPMAIVYASLNFEELEVWLYSNAAGLIIFGVSFFILII